MKQYLDLLKHIIENGEEKADRTGVGTTSVFGYQTRFDLQKGFPMITTKKLHLKSIIYELLWFLNGDTNIQYLKDRGVTIWDEWANEHGDLGPVYGYQWRSWPGKDGATIDQITKLIDQIRTKPDSRRHMVTAWNPADVDRMALPPCHALFQFYVSQPARNSSTGRSRLSCQLYQRSCDTFLGLPFNIASYALLTHMVAQQCDLDPGEFVWTGGDVHIYKNHMEQVNLQLSREPFPLPQLNIRRKPASIFEYQFEDFEILNYQFHPAIKASIAV